MSSDFCIKGIILENWHKRLKEVREKHQLKQQDLSNAIDKDVTRVSRYERGEGAKSMPAFMKQRLLSLFTKAEINYIEYGGDIEEGSKKEDAAATYEKDGQVSIPYHRDVYASAGSGSDTVEGSSISPISFSRSFLNSFLGIYNVNGLSIINAAGNSMEPTIKSGEMMFVYPTDDEDFKDGGIYVLMCSDKLLVKRVTFNPLTKEYTLVSDNGAVAPVTLSIDEGSDCRFIGRVVGHFDRV